EAHLDVVTTELRGEFGEHGFLLGGADATRFATGPSRSLPSRCPARAGHTNPKRPVGWKLTIWSAGGAPAPAPGTRKSSCCVVSSNMKLSASQSAFQVTRWVCRWTLLPAGVKVRSAVSLAVALNC